MIKKIDTRAPSDLVACLAYFSVICHGRRHSGVHAPLPTPTGKDLAGGSPDTDVDDDVVSQWFCSNIVTDDDIANQWFCSCIVTEDDVANQGFCSCIVTDGGVANQWFCS
ncbi:hypothetical protein CDAR_314351 [Caerostris darwini]|uniref:Uncharacterized protein n=1 Tax=Caerostris darwini TaxID=1538125 RepID=A0AAV4TZM0_9ARAC|nr:hypothetical protein CDAR_314351 [Caerostris darwini]